jgi:hypothetical protein
MGRQSSSKARREDMRGQMSESYFTTGRSTMLR